jgi:hypothetical protein
LLQQFQEISRWEKKKKKKKFKCARIFLGKILSEGFNEETGGKWGEARLSRSGLNLNPSRI